MTASHVAVAIALPQDADEESGPYAHTITQFSFWNTESQKWTSSYVNACFEDQCDLAMLYWAPIHAAWVLAGCHLAQNTASRRYLRVTTYSCSVRLVAADVTKFS